MDEVTSIAPASATPEAAPIEFRAATKTYPGQADAAVDELSLEIPSGEICMLVGPSGGGKTTALKMINRLIDFEAGDILIDGRSVRELPLTDLRRGIGYVIQQIGLFPHQTVGANIATVPKLLGWDRKRIKARTGELIELVGLDPDKDAKKYPAQLSGGQRQRIGLARALAGDPPVMLMDEPFGALDPITRVRLQNEFLRLHEEIRKTVVFVTHDIDEAVRMGDRIAILREGGQLAQYDTPESVLASPADDFVADFVGADRGLKRLGLRDISEIEPMQAPSARLGDDGIRARARLAEAELDWLVIVDDDGRPTHFVAKEDLGEGPITDADARPIRAVARPSTRLRDALSVMLSQVGSHLVVVDDDGRLKGYASADLISGVLSGGRDARAPEALRPDIELEGEGEGDAADAADAADELDDSEREIAR